MKTQIESNAQYQRGEQSNMDKQSVKLIFTRLFYATVHQNRKHKKPRDDSIVSIEGRPNTNPPSRMVQKRIEQFDELKNTLWN